MNVNYYEILMNVIKTENITKTADLLGYTQSGVSNILNNLESELGVRLLERGKKGVTLTSDGMKLVPYVREVINAEESLRQAAADVAGKKSGLLRISLMNSISVHYLPPVLKAFVEKYPGVEFELIHGEYDEIQKAIYEGSADCGFSALPILYNLETIKLIEDSFCIITSKKHRFKDCKFVSFEELRKEDFLLAATTEDVGIRKIFEEAEIPSPIKCITQNDYASIAMVEQDLGISIMPKLIASNFKDRICIKPMEKEFSRTICMVVKSMKKASPLTKAFLEFVVEWNRENEAQRDA